MASLTHVCMWSDNGWKRITAEQAAKLHPGGTVSAHSGLFMCELCGQYVSLTDGAVQTRHFRHSAHEKSKNCPERILGAGYSISYGSQEHDLPIRITGVSSSSFRFEVGLIRAPISSLSKDFRIEIKPQGVSDTLYVFTKERLNYENITYDYQLKSPEMVFHRLRPIDFDQEETLNFMLCDYLLSAQSASEHLSHLISQLHSTKNTIFVAQFFDFTTNIPAFIRAFNTQWPSLFVDMQDVDGFNQEQLKLFSVYMLYYLDQDTLDTVNRNKVLTQYIS